MRAKREYRNRRDVEVAVLDALVDRVDDGMTVFELRAAVDTDIDSLEEALEALKSDSLISVESSGSRVVIMPDERVVPDPSDPVDDERGFLDAIRERLGL
ncbi:MAG: DUF6432 family protein [Halobacteriota archaeon]